MEGKVRLLAVDDSAFTLTIISTYLGGSEFEVAATARSGEEALERYREARPDLVLLDLVMPGLSGEETLRRLLELDPGANVVIVSSLGTDEAVQTCLALGARSFLRKPFKREELLGFLRGIAGRGRENA